MFVSITTDRLWCVIHMCNHVPQHMLYNNLYAPKLLCRNSFTTRSLQTALLDQNQ